jgi:hypothetical protein
MSVVVTFPRGRRRRIKSKQAVRPNRPRPPQPPEASVAVTPEIESRADVEALLGAYRDDMAFRKQLLQLAKGLVYDLGKTFAEICRADDGSCYRAERTLRADRQYCDSVETFARDWRLDRLPTTPPDDGGRPIGLEALHAWLLPEFLLYAGGDFPTLTDAWSFGGGIVTGFLVPTLKETDADGRPRFRPCLPPVDITLSGPVPTRESRATAEKRLSNELREQLDAIYGSYKACGYGWDDVKPERERDAGWLYLRLVRGWSYPEIASDWNKDKGEAAAILVDGTVSAVAHRVNVDTLRIAIHRFAKRLGIAL